MSSPPQTKVTRTLLAIILSVLWSSQAAHAEDTMELAQRKTCLACHSIQKKVIGPAFKDVAAKYEGQSGVDERLVQKVLTGGRGSFGETPMPPNSQVTEAEAKQLVRWVLSLNQPAPL